MVSFLISRFSLEIDKSFVRNKLKRPIRARFFRIYPLTWRGMIEMRMELYGCKGKVDVNTHLNDR